MSSPSRSAELPPVLAVGAWLKNAACRLDRTGVTFSELHGDLSDPAACAALDASVDHLLRHGAGRIEAVAHDLHPDFYSTRLALDVAARCGVPAIGVQHHHAHIAAVMAEHRLRRPVVGLALDGFGLGTDGAAWGGELLRVDECGVERLGHLRPIALPGGDAAAREPWRMAAAALHLLGRGDEIAARFEPVVGPVARTLPQMLARDLRSPRTSSLGRWFDAAAAALGISVRQAHEAEAAIALEQRAARWIDRGVGIPLVACPTTADGVLDLGPLLARLFERAGGDDALVDEGAAIFHASLAVALTEWAAHAAHRADIDTVCLGGGCVMNAVLTTRLTAALEAKHLRVLRASAHSCGDAGLALGQAWVAAHRLRASALSSSHEPVDESCVSHSPHA